MVVNILVNLYILRIIPGAISTPNLVALHISSQELGRGGGIFCLSQQKYDMSDSLTIIGLRDLLTWSHPLRSSTWTN